MTPNFLGTEVDSLMCTKKLATVEMRYTKLVLV